jgi:hypothetical protein
MDQLKISNKQTLILSAQTSSKSTVSHLVSTQTQTAIIRPINTRLTHIGDFETRKSLAQIKDDKSRLVICFTSYFFVSSLLSFMFLR